jgi:hypothetical protein
VVHGPVVLGSSEGITVGLRCIFGHPGGLRLPVVVADVNQHAEATGTQRGYQAELLGGRSGAPPRSSSLVLVAYLDGEETELLPYAETSSSGGGRYLYESEYWIDGLPADEHLRVTVSWQQAGLAPATVDLDLTGLKDAAAATIPLL